MAMVPGIDFVAQRLSPEQPKPKAQTPAEAAVADANAAADAAAGTVSGVVRGASGAATNMATSTDLQQELPGILSGEVARAGELRGKADKLRTGKQQTTLGKLGSQEGILTGLAALAALAAGETEAAAGLALGGLSGASQGARQENVAKAEMATKLEDQAQAMSSTALQAATQKFGTTAGVFTSVLETGVGAEMNLFGTIMSAIQNGNQMEFTNEQREYAEAHSIRLTDMELGVRVAMQDKQITADEQQQIRQLSNSLIMQRNDFEHSETMANLESRLATDRLLTQEDQNRLRDSLRYVHEKYIQGQQILSTEKLAEAQRYLEEKLQGNQHAHEVAQLTLQESYNSKARAESYQYGVMRANVDAQLEDWLSANNYTREEQAAFKAALMSVVQKDPYLGSKFIQAMDPNGKYFADVDWTAGAQAADDAQKYYQSQEVVRELAIKNLEMGNAEGARENFAALGFNIPASAIDGYVNAKTAKEKEEKLEAMYETMLPAMSMSSKVAVGQEMARGATLAEAMLKAQVAFDPIAQAGADANRKQEILSKVYQAWIDTPAEERIGINHNQWIQDTLGSGSDYAFISSNGGWEGAILDLRNNETEQWSAEIQMAGQALAASQDETYARALKTGDTAARQRMEIQYVLEQKAAIREAVSQRTFGPGLEAHVGFELDRAARVLGRDIDNAAVRDLALVVASQLPANATQAQVNAEISGLMNDVIAYGQADTEARRKKAKDSLALRIISFGAPEDSWWGRYLNDRVLNDIMNMDLEARDVTPGGNK